MKQLKFAIRTLSPVIMSSMSNSTVMTATHSEIAPTIGNMSSASLKRNRGLGKIRCSMSEGDVLIEKFFRARGL